MSSHKRRVIVPSPLTVKEIQLIDRVEEMQALREIADRAVQGQGGVVFLYGAAGIGKTRLARELGTYARSQGMRVLSVRCPTLFRIEGVPPYILWEEVIKEYMEVCTLEELQRVIGSYPIEVSKLIPEIKHKLRLIPQSFPLNPERGRDRLFEAVSQYITNISREAPLLLVLDDLQWTDQSSLLLLHYLARGLGKEPLLLLGAYRDTYVDEKHPLSPVLAELNRERLLQSIPLKRLSFDSVTEMMKRILGQEDIPGEFCELVFDKTSGNPFFVEEVIRSLEEEEVIYREQKKWKIMEVSEIEFPETVKDVIKARIRRLGDECQRVLTLASLIGKDFTLEALCRVTDIEEDKLLELMERMLKAGLVKERMIRGEGVYSFADIIVRDVVYEEVSFSRRKRLHRVVGPALEKVYAEKIDKHLGELALHFLEGGDKDKALDYFLKAGEKAANVYANNEAVSYFQSALKLLEEKKGEPRERARVLERLGDVKSIVGEYDDCMKYWNKALLLGKQLHDKEKVSRLYRKMANILWDVAGDLEEARGHYDKALKILEIEPESVELASLYEDIAHMYYRTGESAHDIAEASSWAEKALELAKKLDNSEVVASSYASLGTIFAITGDMKKGRERLERALKIALDNGHMDTALRCYANLSSLPTAEENERRLQYCKKGYELAKKVGDIGFISFLSINLADMYIGMGNMNKAMSLAEGSVALCKKTGDTFRLLYSMHVRAREYEILGEWKKSERDYKEALSISQEANMVMVMTDSYGVLGRFLLFKGEYTKAKEHLEKAYEICKKAEAKYDEMFYSRFLIWTYIELGEIEKAKNLLDSLHRSALEVKHGEFIANSHALRAMLFRAQKKWEKSIEHFEKSLQEFEALNARRWNLYGFAKWIFCEYARVYLERDKKGDKEKALNLLNQALEIFQKLGAKKDMEKTKSRMVYVRTGREMVEPRPIVEVLDVDLPDHVTTGYEELDDMLLGGIPRNYAVILTSLSCNERDSLIEDFLETGAKKDEVTFHIIAKASGIESLAQDFQSNFYLFLCNPEADAIIKSLPNVFKLKGVENLNAINIALASAFRKLDKIRERTRRACVEIVSDILLQHHTVQTRRWLNALIPKLRSKGFTTLAVMDPGMHSSQDVRAILDLFDGEINIYEKDTIEGPRKYLKIKKMADQEYLENELPLKKERLQKRK